MIGRPLLRYFGGKMRLRRWILAHLPRHAIYCEPFVGGGSILLGKEPAPWGETINDLDGEIVNLFRTLRGERGPELIRQIELTPYSRDEHALAFEPAEDSVERARRLLVRSHMSHGTISARMDRTRGWRRDGLEAKTHHAREWRDLLPWLDLIRQRLAHVSIERRDAIELIGDFSKPNVLIYADPPYWPATRSGKRIRGEPYHAYQHELDESGHASLLAALHASDAMVVLSGYDNPLYARELAGWRLETRGAHAYGQVDRIECLWINPAAARAIESGPLFAEAAE